MMSQVSGNPRPPAGRCPAFCSGFRESVYRAPGAYRLFLWRLSEQRQLVGTELFGAEQGESQQGAPREAPGDSAGYGAVPSSRWPGCPSSSVAAAPTERQVGVRGPWTEPRPLGGERGQGRGSSPREAGFSPLPSQGVGGTLQAAHSGPGLGLTSGFC